MSADKSQGKNSSGLTRREALQTALKAGAGAALLTFLGRTAAGAEAAAKILAAADTAPQPGAGKMQYRRFGKLDWKVSALGFGCMRLPTKDGVPQSPDIDYGAFSRMMASAVERGVNYVDTAWFYHNGQGEPALGKVLKENSLRDKVRISTKSPVRLIEGPGDFDKYLNAQLKRLQTDHIDLYLLHALDRKGWDKVKKFGVLERAEAAKKDGRIGHIGFSFHGKHDIFEEILNGWDKWELCMLQYNYIDINYQAGSSGVKQAAAKGLAVIAMEPLRGGGLANPPASVREIMDSAEFKRPPVAWAFDWLWSQPEVSVVLSGMGSQAQMDENLTIAAGAGLRPFTGADQKIIGLVREALQKLKSVPCTYCGYCAPCPAGVNIPRNFELYNDSLIYGDLTGARKRYANWLSAEARASHCVKCRVCEKKCPQHIKISEWMPKVDDLLSTKS
jgi:predicted aldo/keto reductase-like oxidoreductase